MTDAKKHLRKIKDEIEQIGKHGDMDELTLEEQAAILAAEYEIKKALKMIGRKRK